MQASVGSTGHDDLMTIPIFVTCRDRVTCLRLLVDRLERMDGIGPIILVDNDSAWPPLVDYLEASPHEVVRLGINAGHRAVWDQTVRPELRSAGPFVVTDPDVVPDAECPDDAVLYLAAILEQHPEVAKVGLGLRIDDLPAGRRTTADITDWESQFWENPVTPGLYDAAVDTTFAVYRAGAGPEVSPALRTGNPYVARHLPWYDDVDEPVTEEVFYRTRARADTTNWHGNPLRAELAAGLERRRRNLRGQADHPLLDAWAAEPPLTDETAFTPWAEPGWPSWNPMSAEVDFCEFVCRLTRMLRPARVLETGIGQGYTTRRVAAVLGEGVHLCFENDDPIRAGLASLAFFDDDRHLLLDHPTPHPEDFIGVGLTLLDSEPPDRYSELRDWRTAAEPGSVLVVHDCGNGHVEDTPHAHLRRLVEELDIPGVFLSNPRGSFLGIHPGEDGLVTLRTQLERATIDAAELREELARMHATRSWRVTSPLRALLRMLDDRRPTPGSSRDST
jgi:hypothetical protein